MKATHPAKDADGPVLCERRIQYILTTANNCSGPIRNFRLRLTAGAPGHCGHLRARPEQVAPAHYELVRSNYRPSRELDVLILQPAKPFEEWP